MPERMKIGINCRFIHAARVTGVERYARNLLASLIETRQNVEFTLFGCANKPDFVADRNGISIIGSCHPDSSVKRQLWEQFRLPGLVRKAGVDLLINPINTAPISVNQNLVVIHDLAFIEHPEWFSGSFGRFYRMVVPRSARRAKAVMTVSEFSKGRIVELLGVPEERVHVIYQGVDPAFRPAGEEKTEQVRHKFGLNSPYVLFVGSLEPRKNLPTVIQAFIQANNRLNKTYTLAVAGLNSFQFARTDTPLNAEGVKAIGYANDDDLPGLYSGAEVLVYPSLYEGFGLPPLEAMACGTPVITSDCASLPEVVGDAGITVGAMDVDGLSEAICRVLTDDKLAEDMKTRSLARAERFTWQQTAEYTLEVCSRIVNAGSG